MPETNADGKKPAPGHYWRVIVTYSDNETSVSRTFKERDKVERYAARQKKSPVVKKALIEHLVRQQFRTRPAFRRSNTT